MIECKISIYLSYIMLIYTISSIYYMIITKYFNIGTPFKNTLTKAQIIIKKKSASKRFYIFYQGLVIGLIISILFEPFRKCY